MAKRIRPIAVAVKLETTAGTDSVPTFTGNAVLPVGSIPVPEYAPLETGDRDDYYLPVLGAPDRSAPGGWVVTTEVTLPVRGAGVAYDDTPLVVPEMHVLLLASGMSATFTNPGIAGASVAYKTVDDAMPTFSMYVLESGFIHKFVGCVCVSTALSAAANGEARVTFGIRGIYSVVPADSAFTTPTLSAVTAPTFQAAPTVSIGAWTNATPTNPLVLRRFGLDFGTAYEDSPSAGHANGVLPPTITNRAPELEMEVEAVPLTVFNPYQVSRRSGSEQVTFGEESKAVIHVGSAQYNRLKLSTGRWSLRHPTSGGTGIKLWTLAGRLVAGTHANGRELELLFD